MAKPGDKLSELQSPISFLPLETLSLILKYACPVPDLNKMHGLPDLSRPPSPATEMRPQFILGAVSSHWRQVLHSTPCFWTAVDLKINPHTAKKAPEILRAFFTYSGELPLAIGLQFGQFSGGCADILVDAALRADLRPNAHRIRELYLRDAPDTWLELLPTLPNLINLILNPRRMHQERTVIRSQCSYFTLKSYAKPMQLSCSEITVLHLYKVCSYFCLELLQACRNLIEYRCRQPDGFSWGANPHRNPIIFPHMEVFEWPVSGVHITDETLLYYARMPTLREFVWVDMSVEEPTEEVTDARDRFLRNLPSSLTVLHVHNATANPYRSIPVILRLIYDLHDIEHLIISGVEHDLPDQLFEGLTPALDAQGNQQQVMLQKLKSVFVQGNFGSTGLDQNNILRMLEWRFLKADVIDQEPFQLEFGFRMAWLPQSKQKLKEMTACGLKVEILEDARAIDWL